MATKSKLNTATSAASSGRRGAPAVDAVKAEAERSAIAAFVAALIAAIQAMVRFVFGGTWASLGRDVAGVRRAAGVARSVGDRALVAAGKGLEGPARAVDLVASGIGSTLGALLPTAPVTAKAFADAAVSHDDVAPPAPSRAPASMIRTAILGQSIQMAASNRIEGGEHPYLHTDDLPRAVVAWLDTLDRRQLAVLADMEIWGIEAHVSSRSRSELLPPVRQLTPAEEARVHRPLDIKSLLSAARKNERDMLNEITALRAGGTGGSMEGHDDAYTPRGWKH